MLLDLSTAVTDQTGVRRDPYHIQSDVVYQRPLTEDVKPMISLEIEQRINITLNNIDEQ